MNVNDLESLSQARFEHQQAKQNLKERADQQLIFAHGDGLFRASPELIVFLTCWTDDTLVLQDLYQNPVQVDRAQILEQARQCYQYAMNAWYLEYQQIKHARRGRDV